MDCCSIEKKKKRTLRLLSWSFWGRGQCFQLVFQKLQSQKMGLGFCLNFPSHLQQASTLVTLNPPQYSHFFLFLTLHFEIIWLIKKFAKRIIRIILCFTFGFAKYQSYVAIIFNTIIKIRTLTLIQSSMLIHSPYLNAANCSIHALSLLWDLTLANSNKLNIVWG